MKAHKKHADRVAAAVAAGECLIGGCDAAAEIRGVCRHHYNKFNHRKTRMSDEAFDEFETNAVALGLILPAGVVSRTKTDAFTGAEN